MNSQPFVKKIETGHRTFIATQMAEFTRSPSKIQAMLADPEKAKEYGFETVDVGIDWVSKLINHDQEIIELALQFQLNYLRDYSKVRLAHKKERVLDLIDLYESIDTLMVGSGGKRKPLSDSQKFDKKRHILAQIASETDQTLPGLTKALLDNTKTTLTLHQTILGYYKVPDDKPRTEETQAQPH